MALPANVTAGTWTVDPAHSSVGFSVRHAGISKVKGTFEKFDAALTVGDSLESSSVTADIEIGSIDTRDENRDAHVKGEDFFNAEQFPMMTFRSTSMSGEPDDLTVEGELTIRDQTRPVTLTGEISEPVTDPFGTLRLGVEVETTISRKDFGITWNAALEAGGVMVSDKVKIEIDAEFVAPQS